MQLYEDDEGELSPVSWGSGNTRPSLPPLPAMNESDSSSDEDDGEPVSIVFSHHKYEAEAKESPLTSSSNDQPIVNISKGISGMQVRISSSRNCPLSLFLSIHSTCSYPSNLPLHLNHNDSTKAAR